MQRYSLFCLFENKNRWFLASNGEKRTFFHFFKQKNSENIFFTEKSCTFASHLSIGLWCNGNTADSGPAFPGSSPGSPTERFPNGNLFFCFVLSTIKNIPPQSDCGGMITFDDFLFYLKHFSATNCSSFSLLVLPTWTEYSPSIGMKSRVGMPLILNASAISGS